jgi:diguanylate cyclase (GGDEF)-like protein
MKNLERSIPVGGAEFFQKTLDSMLSHIAILAEDGEILAVNAAWNRFACGNGLEEDFCGPGPNYLRACDQAAGACSEEARFVSEGIRDVIAGRKAAFTLEYPCHSPTERHWYCVRITRFEVDGIIRVVVSHDNITERKLAEIRVRKANRKLRQQASTDGLTGLANRRCFDRELGRNWGRMARSGRPLGVLLLDVDCFKLYNDHFGHLAGDDCLREVSLAIRTSLSRAGELAARYGGEEFVVLLPKGGESRVADASAWILEAVRDLAIPHPQSSTGRGIVTVSIGRVSVVPGPDDSPERLLHRADRALYEAKAKGRDRGVSADSLEPARSA